MSEMDLQRQIDAIVGELDKYRRMEHPFAFQRTIMREMQINSGETGKYLRIASLPATGAGTGDSLVIEFFGGQVGSDNQFRGVLRAGNRTATNVYVEWLSGDTSQLTYARIVAYTNSGVTTFYLRLPGTSWAFIAARVEISGWGTQPTLYPGESESTSTPAGSLVFDSYTATGLLTQTNAGNLYSVPWTDYSAISTIVGWSSFTTKEIKYKRLGKLVFVAFCITGTSDSTSLTFTLPVAMPATWVISRPVARSVDNGAAGIGYVRLPSSTLPSSSVQAYPDAAGSNWTNSGTKSIEGQFFYES
jgi:hypothetical protein